MTLDPVTTTFQKGFRLALGATATLLEVIQDPQSSGERFMAFGGDMGQVAATLETKGETTEREARQFVDQLISQIPSPFVEGPIAPTVDTVATPVADVSVQSDLAALTQDLADLRQAIETLKANQA